MGIEKHATVKFCLEYKYKRVHIKMYNLKDCCVKLVRGNFSKIKIKCSAHTSEPDIDLKCNIIQDASNTFTVQIKRKVIHKSETPKPSKRFKFSSVDSTGIFGFASIVVIPIFN